MSLPLIAAMDQCQRHVQILAQAMREIPQPVTSELLRKPSAELLRVLDQFVLRFTKLQDTMGTHILRQFVVQVFFEPMEDAPFADVLGVLERQNIFSAHDWALQRSVRNALTHEYPDDPQRIVLALNDAMRKAQQLTEWLELIRNKTLTT